MDTNNVSIQSDSANYSSLDDLRLKINRNAWQDKGVAQGIIRYISDVEEYCGLNNVKFGDLRVTISRIKGDSDNYLMKVTKRCGVGHAKGNIKAWQRIREVLGLGYDKATVVSHHMSIEALRNLVSAFQQGKAPDFYQEGTTIIKKPDFYLTGIIPGINGGVQVIKSDDDKLPPMDYSHTGDSQADGSNRGTPGAAGSRVDVSLQRHDSVGGAEINKNAGTGISCIVTKEDEGTLNGLHFALDEFIRKSIVYINAYIKENGSGYKFKVVAEDMAGGQTLIKLVSEDYIDTYDEFGITSLDRINEIFKQVSRGICWTTQGETVRISTLRDIFRDLLPLSEAGDADFEKEFVFPDSPGKDAFNANEIPIDDRLFMSCRDGGFNVDLSEDDNTGDWYVKAELPPLGLKCRFIITTGEDDRYVSQNDPFNIRLTAAERDVFEDVCSLQNVMSPMKADVSTKVCEQISSIYNSVNELQFGDDDWRLLCSSYGQQFHLFKSKLETGFGGIKIWSPSGVVMTCSDDLKEVKDRLRSVLKLIKSNCKSYGDESNDGIVPSFLFTLKGSSEVHCFQGGSFRDAQEYIQSIVVKSVN